MDEDTGQGPLRSLAGSARRAGPRTRVRISIAAAAVLLLAGLTAAVLATMLGDHGGTTRVPEVDVHTRIGPSASRTPTPTPSAILVHVVGAVKTPGLFRLPRGARVIDAVAAAGGLADTADPAGVNLAATVTDGQQLRIPHQGEAITPQPAAPGASGGKIDLNTATAAELEELPGIGEVMADRIVAWRTEHGPFGSTRDLMKISGIGDKTFAALEDLVTV